MREFPNMSYDLYERFSMIEESERQISLKFWKKKCYNVIRSLIESEYLMAQIFVLGSINMNLVFQLERMPEIGETIHSNGFFMVPGGKGANQAVACAKQDIDTYMIGSLGNDALSMTCIESLKSNGVKTEYVSVIEGRLPGVAGIFLEKGDNRIVVDAGANASHDIDHIKKIIEEAKGVPDDILLCQLEIPLKVVEESFLAAKKKDMKTVLNAAPATHLTDTLYSLTDLLVVNESEMEILTGIDLSDESDIEIAAKKILHKGVRGIILTLGKKGSVYFDSEKRIDTRAVNVLAKDTTAAGDTYIGVLLSEILKGSSTEEAMRKASFASALTVTRLGAQQSIPSKNEIEIFIKQKESNHE